MHVDAVAPAAPQLCCCAIWLWLREAHPRQVIRSFSLSQAKEVKVISGVLRQACLLDGLSHSLIHTLHRPVLPEKDLLNGSSGGVSLWKHGHHNVDLEVLPCLNFVHNTLCNFTGYGVHGFSVLVIQPREGAAQEVLVLHVDEILGVADLLHHALGDAVLEVGALLAAQPAQPLLLEEGRVGADGAEELGVPEPALVARRNRRSLGRGREGKGCS